MRPRIVWTIFAKEIVDTLRDRRTLFAMFVVPVLLYPLLFTAMGRITAGAEASRKALRPTVVAWGTLPEPARAALAKEFGDGFTARPAPGGDRAAAARRLVEAKEADLVVAAPDDAAARFGADVGIMLDAWYDDVIPRSSAARDRAVKALDAASLAERDARLKRRGLPDRFDRPFTVDKHDLAGKARRGGEVAGHILPFILIFVMVLGGLLPAIDLTAGEKERGTLQTLLTAPVRPVEIVAGKYVTVVALSLVGAAANLGAMGFTLQQQVAALGKEGVEFSLGIGTTLAVFAAMLPCALLFSAVLLALAVFARGFREANAYLSPVLLVLSFPAMVSLVPTVELDATTAFAPVVNLALLIREMLRGPVAPSLYFGVVLANLVYATLAILFAARVFETEQVLLGGEQPWRDLFGDARRVRVTPSPRQAVFFVAVLTVVTYYGALLIMRRGLPGIVGLAVVQAGLLLGPAVVFVVASRLSLRETLLLRLPAKRARGIAGAVLLAAGAWAVGAVVQMIESRLFPNARAYYELFEKALADLDAPLGLSLVVVAAMPAIAEEACFRGVVLQGLANTGWRRFALVGSAVIFGLFHVNPYHAIGAGSLGLLFGWAAIESGSILPGMLAHFVNNGLAMVMLRYPSIGPRIERGPALAAGILVAFVGLWLLRGTRAARSD